MELEPQHIRARPGDVAKRAVISGDPARIVQLSKLLRHARLVSENRGFLTYTGEYEGTELTVACHGIGGPSAAIVAEELVMYGAKAVVRLGTCGGLLKPMRVGDVVIPTRAGFKGGAPGRYFEGRRTLRPDAGLARLVTDSVNRQGTRHSGGPVFSTDSFYADTTPFFRTLAKKGFVAVEMECAILFGVGELRGAKTAAALLVSDNLVVGEPMADAAALSKHVEKTGTAVFEALGRLKV